MFSAKILSKKHHIFEKVQRRFTVTMSEPESTPYCQQLRGGQEHAVLTAQSTGISLNLEEVEQVGSVVDPENERLEYKSLQLGNGEGISVKKALKLLEEKKNELNAMVNVGGGVVKFGIGEEKQLDGSIKCIVEPGIMMTTEEKQKISDAIHRIFFTFYPRCSSDGGDYEIKWIETIDDNGDKRYRFTVIVKKCRAHERGRIVFTSMSRAEAYTRSGTSTVHLTPDMIQQNLIQAFLMKGDAKYVRLVQASIDAGLIQRLRDATDRYCDKKMEKDEIICLLHRCEREIGRQKYRAYIVFEEIIQFMELLSFDLKNENTEIEIAFAILELGDVIHSEYGISSPHWCDNDLYMELDDKIAQNWDRFIEIIQTLFNVCFTVADFGLKYRVWDEVFAKATVVLAEILGKLNFIIVCEDDERVKKCSKKLNRQYDKLNNSIQESCLDDSVKDRLRQLLALLRQRYVSVHVETDSTKTSEIDQNIYALGYDCM